MYGSSIAALRRSNAGNFFFGRVNYGGGGGHHEGGDRQPPECVPSATHATSSHGEKKCRDLEAAEALIEQLKQRNSVLEIENRKSRGYKARIEQLNQQYTELALEYVHHRDKKLDQLEPLPEQQPKQIVKQLEGMEEDQNQQQQKTINELTEKLRVSLDQFLWMQSDQQKAVLVRLNGRDEHEHKLSNFLGQFIEGRNKKFEEHEETKDRRMLQKQMEELGNNAKKELEKGMNQLKGEVITKMEEYQQQQNIDKLKSDQKALLERQQQKTDQKALGAPIDRSKE